MAPGVLANQILHPTEFPNSPYASACAHHTHRREFSWEIKCYVTTAANTGFRACAIILPNPEVANTSSLPQELVWSAIQTRSATMMTSTGTGAATARIRVPTTTGQLSNAAPPSSTYVGFCSGSIAVVLLNAPIGVTANTSVTITVLGRVSMQVLGPMTGFMAWANTPTPGPSPTPSPGFSLIVANPATDNVPINSHTASAWLAGGCYLHLPATRPTWANGALWSFAVYTADHQGINWQDNDSQSFEPYFYTVWHEPASGVIQVVGFANRNYAQLQAEGETGAIPHGAELCITYQNKQVPWNTRFENMATTNATIHFSLVYKGKNASQLWAATATLPQGYVTPAVARATFSADALLGDWVDGPPPPNSAAPVSTLPALTVTGGSSSPRRNGRPPSLRDLMRSSRPRAPDLTPSPSCGPQPTPSSERSPPSRAAPEVEEGVDPLSWPPLPPPYSSFMPYNHSSYPPSLQSAPACLNCPTPPHNSSPPSPEPQTPSSSSLEQLVSWFNNLLGTSRHSSAEFPGPSRAPSPRSAIDCSSATAGMPLAPPTGSQPSPGISRSLECPGCWDPDCDWCYEDA